MINASKEGSLGGSLLQQLRVEILGEQVMREIHKLPPGEVSRLTPLEARKLVERCMNERLRED